MEKILKPFSNDGSFKKWLDEKLIESFSNDHVEKVRKFEEEKKKADKWAEVMKGLKDWEDYNVYNTIYSYCVYDFFNPFEDNYEIISSKYNEDKTMVMFTVECLKNRQHLGVAGTWIPDLYSTGWIKISELEEIENGNN